MSLRGALFPLVTRDEFKAMELAAPPGVRLERVGGYVYAMAGAGLAHERIVARFVEELGQLARQHGCQTFGSNRRLSMPDDSDVLPDVSVYCDPDDDDDYAGYRPCLVVEVLSKSTAMDDLNLKLPRYQNVPSIETIVIINPEPLYADVFVRLGNEWTRTNLTSPGDLLVLTCPPCSLPLSTFLPGSKT